ncbi:MAG TPA: NapC/NirT family cytochrome c [Steroidobacteraceae bacterium]|nr:NapC/NirT family cytochrome c [Steroidobacteraceae bacterium]
MDRKRSIKAAIVAVFAIAVVPAGVVAAWMVTETMVEETSGAEFCGSCHTMAPMVASYRADVHGGAGLEGVQAKCNYCHVPADNVFIYMVKKAQFGLHDVWAQLTYDLDEIDWQAKRAHRTTYVFDSGCLNCHENVERATAPSAAAFIAHRSYFLGETDVQCVSCHPHVGHADLGRHLDEA